MFEYNQKYELYKIISLKIPYEIRTKHNNFKSMV